MSQIGWIGWLNENILGIPGVVGVVPSNQYCLGLERSYSKWRKKKKKKKEKADFKAETSRANKITGIIHRPSMIALLPPSLSNPPILSSSSPPVILSLSSFLWDSATFIFQFHLFSIFPYQPRILSHTSTVIWLAGNLSSGPSRESR